MARWYAEKLIDPDFVTNNDKNFEAKVAGDIVASYQDGQPVLTDLIKKNPNKLPIINALSQHVWSASSGPGLQLERDEATAIWQSVVDRYDKR